MAGTSRRQPQGHGGVRGADSNPRSTQTEGRFGRIFRALPSASWPDDALKKLAAVGGMVAEPEVDETNPRLPIAPDEEMDGDPKTPRTSRLHDAEENSGIAAGYTYFGQFIDHDLTFDPASSLQQRNDVNALVDFRTPRFDLDCIYGSGPDDQPYMYESDEKHFILGRELTEGPGGKVMTRDLPRFSWTDKDGEHHRALIGDKRNDENVIVSQLQGVFLQFHNRMVDIHPDFEFAEVQRRVRWHYQYAVLNDFLPTIAREDVIKAVLPHLTKGGTVLDHAPDLRFYHPRESAFMPVEFAAAAYRFGHSMVRPIYRLNTKLNTQNPAPDSTNPLEKDRGIIGRQFIFAGLKERGLNGFDAFPSEWGIDWNLFFDLDGKSAQRVKKDRTQPSYKIDTSLVNPLAFLPEFSTVDTTVPQPPLTDLAQLQAKGKPGKFPNLAERNLLRGKSMGLPSGQDVALAMGLTPLTEKELRVGKAINEGEDKYEDLPTISSIDPTFKNKAPLWFYVLAEAANDWHKNGGTNETPVKLGAVGSRIVVETFVGLLMEDSHSYLRQAPGWKPTVAARNGKFGIAELIQFALQLP